MQLSIFAYLQSENLYSIVFWLQEIDFTALPHQLDICLSFCKENSLILVIFKPKVLN